MTKLVDRYLFVWKIYKIWRNRKYIIESKKLDLEIKYLSWKIKRIIKKNKNA